MVDLCVYITHGYSLAFAQLAVCLSALCSLFASPRFGLY